MLRQNKRGSHRLKGDEKVKRSAAGETPRLMAGTWFNNPTKETEFASRTALRKLRQKRVMPKTAYYIYKVFLGKNE